MWNHLNLWGPISVDCGCFAYSWGCYFMDASISVYGRKLTLSKSVFIEDANSCGRATHEYHSDESTAYWTLENKCILETVFWLRSFLECWVFLSSKFRLSCVRQYNWRSSYVLSRCLIILNVMDGKCFVYKLARASNINEIRWTCYMHTQQPVISWCDWLCNFLKLQIICNF